MSIHPGIYQVLLLLADVAELVKVVPERNSKANFQAVNQLILCIIGQVIIRHDILELVERKYDRVFSLARQVNGFIFVSDLQAELNDVILDRSPRESYGKAVLVRNPLRQIRFQLQVHKEVAVLSRYILLIARSHYKLKSVPYNLDHEK